MIFTNPRLDEKIILEYYCKEGQIRRDNLNAGQKELRNIQKEFILNNILSKNLESILDIGCDAGYFLSLFDDNILRTGIDPSLDACKTAEKKYGLKTVCATIKSFETNSEYDLICMRHLLEHILDINSELQIVRKLISKNGYLFIEAQNLENCDKQVLPYFYLEHFYYFMPDTITMLLEKNGFEIIKIKEQMNPADSDCPYEVIRVLAKPKPNFVFKVRNTFEKTENKIKNYFANMKKVYMKELLLEEIFREWKNKNKKVGIFGASGHTVFLIKNVDFPLDNISFFYDNDNKKIGKKLFGKIIKHPSDIPYDNVDEILISSKAFENEIFDSIKNFENNGLKIRKLYNVR